MRMLLLYILLVAFGCQQTTVNGQQTPFFESENLKTSESEKGCEQRAMSNEQRFRKAQSSQHEAQSLKKTVDCCPLTVDYFENQIRIADSLYKNYLPQYNFEEVKKAVEFLESENLKTSETEKRLKAKDKGLKSESRKDAKSQSDCLYDSATLRPYDPATAYRMSVDCCPLTVDIEYQRARAHYYHAVGLTERDDIVGACEHYFIALEIMELDIEKLKTSKSGKGSEQRAMSRNSEMLTARSSKLKAMITKK